MQRQANLSGKKSIRRIRRLGMVSEMLFLPKHIAAVKATIQTISQQKYNILASF